MSEITEKSARKQFAKFANAYEKRTKVNLVWHDYDYKNKEAWDFSGIDLATETILYIQYTEGIVNQVQKANIEAHKRGEYEFKYAHGIKPFTEVAENAYILKQKMADKNFVLLIGFHDIFYDENDKYDDIKSIMPYMQKKYGPCAFKEVWIINEADNSCNLIFK
ncbi:TPA: hypothetical protein DIC39_03030 [Patescibacteria group bacterium]|nr:MAG: hypothetical protein A2006_11665 [Ignavibacteria bacterium GWC2_35_8]OGW71167.1 MAG: hypothetical protein A2047_03940 [Omnitrophica bacterium GWA2_41_15]HCU48005.1 hypothetical protein [Patescibacteria group bacterium]